MNTVEINQNLIDWGNSRSNMQIDQKCISVGGYPLNTINVSGNIFTYDISRWALGQLGTRLGIPVRYLRKCPADLLAHNMNYWVRKLMDRKLQICLRGGTNIIGIVSTRFTNYPNLEMYENILHACGGLPIALSPADYNLTNEVMDIRFLFPALVQADSHGDTEKVGLGIHVRNSEVGSSSAIVAATIHDYTNNVGIVVDHLLRLSLVRMVHSRRNHDQFRDGIVQIVTALTENYEGILDAYSAVSNYSITVGDLRTMIEEHQIARDALDGHLGVELFGEDTEDSYKVNLRDAMDAIARHAATQEYPARWNIERIGGRMFSKIDTSVIGL